MGKEQVFRKLDKAVHTLEEEIKQAIEPNPDIALAQEALQAATMLRAAAEGQPLNLLSQTQHALLQLNREKLNLIEAIDQSNTLLENELQTLKSLIAGAAPEIIDAKVNPDYKNELQRIIRHTSEHQYTQTIQQLAYKIKTLDQDITILDQHATDLLVQFINFFVHLFGGKTLHEELLEDKASTQAILKQFKTVTDVAEQKINQQHSLNALSDEIDTCTTNNQQAMQAQTTLIEQFKQQATSINQPKSRLEQLASLGENLREHAPSQQSVGRLMDRFRGRTPSPTSTVERPASPTKAEQKQAQDAISQSVRAVATAYAEFLTHPTTPNLELLSDTIAAHPRCIDGSEAFKASIQQVEEIYPVLKTHTSTLGSSAEYKLELGKTKGPDLDGPNNQEDFKLN